MHHFAQHIPKSLSGGELAPHIDTNAQLELSSQQSGNHALQRVAVTSSSHFLSFQTAKAE